MTKDVLVSVRGAHIADGETNNLEVITAGSYYFKNGKHYWGKKCCSFQFCSIRTKK